MPSEMEQHTTDAAQTDHSCLSFIQLACFHVRLLFTLSLIAFLPQCHQRQAWETHNCCSLWRARPSPWVATETQTTSATQPENASSLLSLIPPLFEKLFHSPSDVHKSPGSAHRTLRIRACFSVCQQEVRRSPAACGWWRTSGFIWEFIGSLLSETTLAGKSQETPDSQPHPKPKRPTFKLPFLTPALPWDSCTTISLSTHHSSV